MDLSTLLCLITFVLLLILVWNEDRNNHDDFF